MDEQKDAKYQTHLSGPTQGFVQGEHNTVILVSKEPERADSTQRQTPAPRPLWIRLCCWLAKQRSLFWGTIIFGILLNLLATWLVSPWGSTFVNTPLGTLLNHSGICLGIGVGLFALTGMVTVVSRSADASALHMHSSQGPTQQNRSAYVQALHQEYLKQLRDSLQNVAIIEVGLHERVDTVRSARQFRLSTAVEHPLPSDTSILKVYDEAKQGLLILGKPGAGKTTLLLELACALLSRAEGDSMHPIPVILNLSSWASRKGPLQHWLIGQLRLVYGIPPRFSRVWLEQDQWLLLLDGLDEVEETSHRACVKAINAYREEHSIPLVVCSRSNEYEFLSLQDVRLALPSTVVVQPLEEAQVTKYLKRLGKSMAAVRAVVRDNPTLRQLITTPLMLHVVVLAYRDKKIRDLPQLGSPEEQQRQIFESYIQERLELQTKRGQFTLQQARCWLIWLAQQMKHRNLTEFYLEWLQPSWLTIKSQYFTYYIFSRLFFGLLYGLVPGLLFLIVGLVLGEIQSLFFILLLFGLGSGLLSGLVDWLSSWSRKESLGEIHPIEVVKWSQMRFLQALLFGLVAFPLLGLLSGLFSGLVKWLGYSQASNLGIIVISPALLYNVFRQLGRKKVWARPNQGIRNSGWNALRFGLIIGPMLGLMLGIGGVQIFELVIIKTKELGFWPISWLRGMQSLEVVIALAEVLVAGLVIGLLVGLLVGLFRGVSVTQVSEDVRTRPNQGIRNSGWNALRFGLIGGLCIWLLFGLLFMRYFGLIAGLQVGLLFVPSIGLLAGLIFGGKIYLSHYILRYLFYQSGSMPWHYIRFLEEMTDCSLLQRGGGGYRFVHALLLDYFASLEPEASSSSIPQSE